MATIISRHVSFTGPMTVGFADVGSSGTPGSGASQERCWLRINNRGRWIAESSYSVGCNQGYYQENYGYGPWEGRGDTPSEAISAMMRRVPGEYAASIRNAGHDAQNQAERVFGSDWAKKTWAEVAIERQRELLASEYQSVKYSPFGDKGDPSIDAWREAEIKRLEKKISSTSPLSHIDDADLLAECMRRGLMATEAKPQ